ncbi:UDP-N-acetylmuramyl tripeptide synthase [Saccharothrix tamanrassetensis]|uniref:Lipid II isoglutaminyl synthase (glutamine-hydrolyzing) subunit MurT n=1 Tax=Saccharothrix tamanrassetensis TaxID=1051531 RepID=A0A841CGB7_9PSEU|nr:MurT ligase domain-containing protein [Saccharothrix tamanrassetensis]MBB5957562.1 UDP-N-acetylmuramyl tripeptide synthase [Saccharothrix tamanrassetensis]
MSSKLSQKMGLGAGGMIGGRVALKLDPQALAHLTSGRSVALVTGTNGKTTSTMMLSRAVSFLGQVATNHGGANMPDGHVTALSKQPDAPYAVLEVDEGYFPEVCRAAAPAVAVLLNLSRDQLDRVGEVRTIEKSLRTALGSVAGVVVANCDDIMVTSAARDCANVVWVATGTGWHNDAASCPRCGDPIRWEGEHWHCTGCDLARPRPDWVTGDGYLVAPDGEKVALSLRLPGKFNLANAVMATAAAFALGVPVREAVERLRAVSDVAGRYRTIQRSGHRARLLLSKNPAGWSETLTVVREADHPAVLVINAQEADGRDLSWLWDVPFERLRGRRVIASGERATDLAVRLTYAEVEHTIVPDPLKAIDAMPPGAVEVIANYTAFRDLNARAAQ